MRFSMTFEGKLAAHLIAEADVHKVRPSTLVRSAVATMVKDDLLDTMIADIDLKEEDRFEGGWRGNYIHEGRRVSLASLAREHGMSASTLYRRVSRLGWSIDRAISEPIKGSEGRP